MTAYGVGLLLIYVAIGYCIGFARGRMLTKKDLLTVIKIIQRSKPLSDEQIERLRKWINGEVRQ